MNLGSSFPLTCDATPRQNNKISELSSTKLPDIPTISRASQIQRESRWHLQ